MQPVALSKRAAEEVKIIMKSDEIPNDYCLRIGVKDGGCGEDGFTIGFDAKKETDLVYSLHDVQILVDKKHVMYVLGKEVNYREEGDEWGFVFSDAKSEKQD